MIAERGSNELEGRRMRLKTHPKAEGYARSIRFLFQQDESSYSDKEGTDRRRRLRAMLYKKMVEVVKDGKVRV